MPVNNFEKQVQDKMGELRLHPGEPVWENIEKEISKKKRKKRFLFLLPLMAGLLLLGYTGFRYFVHPTNKSQSGKNIRPPGELKNNDIVSKEDDNKNELMKTARKGVTKNITKTRNVSTPDRSISLYKEPAKDNNNVVDKTDDPSTRLTSPDKALIKAENISEKVKKEIPGADSSSVQQNRTAMADTSAGITSPVDTKSEIVIQPKTAKQKMAKNSSWGFSFSAGQSNTRNKLLSFSRSSVQDYNNGNVSAGQGPLTPRVSPSATRPGLFVRLGLIWEKEITPKSKFSTGLHYTYFSDRINVGNRINAPLQLSSVYLSGQTVSGYYGGVQQKKFTDRYHFMEIPVGYQLQLDKNKNLPFTWNIGVSMSRLISTNALVYDTAGGGVYYHNSELFKKTHFSFLTGLALRFNKRNGMAWSIGPQWSIDMTRTVKEGFNKNRYLLAGYLEIRLLLPGKVKK
jgi:hypothetical protein